MAKKRLRKGEARVQLIACRDRVNELAEAGYGPVMMFEILTGEKRISMSYSGFYEAYRYGKVRKERRKSFSNNVNRPPISLQSHIKPTVSSGVKLPELEKAMELAVAKRGEVGTNKVRDNHGYSRKDVIG